jgi:pyridoxal phosphate enzyme (YggS family)
VTTVPVRVADVRSRIDAAAKRAGRAPGSVTIVAATKSVRVPRLREAVAAGVTDLGENRAQDLTRKAAELDAPARWHFIGRLQRNKVRALSPWVQLWQSVDRTALAETIARAAPGSRVLLEVNLASEPQKGGCAPAAVGALADAASEIGLRVDGLMTVPPQHEDPRRFFAALRGLAVDLGLRELSMGMSDDFEVAVEEGATIVRLGRVLFGERPQGSPPAGTASVT